MNIQIGKVYMNKVTNQKTIYPNKSRKYLLPCLKEHGTDFINKLNNVFKVAVGVGDVIVDNCGMRYEKHMFILIDTTVANKFFLDFISWIKDQPMYQDDYVFGNIQSSPFHMVVVNLPVKFWDSFEHFKVGAYSKMFDTNTVNTYFNNHPTHTKVLLKDLGYRPIFVKKLNRIYKSEVNASDWDGELDLPPIFDLEIFNEHLKLFCNNE